MKIKNNFIKFVFLSSLFFLILFLININIIAQQQYMVKEIIILGNNTISDTEIENYLKIKNNDILSSESLINIEEKLLNWGYFSFVSVELQQIHNDTSNSTEDEKNGENKDENSTQSGKVNDSNIDNFIEINIKIEVIENLPIKSIILKNSNIYLSNFKQKMKLKERKAFNPKFLEMDLQTLSSYPFVSRVSSAINEDESSISVNIFIKFKNHISSEINVSKFFFGDFNYFFGKSFLPFYLSIFSFYPFESENFYPIFAASFGFSVFKNIYFNITYSSLFSNSNLNFNINNFYFSLNSKNYLIKSNNISFFFNPLSISFSYNLNNKEFNNLFIYFDSFFKLKNIISLFLKSNFVYYFDESSFIYGNVPNNGKEITLTYNQNYYQFSYPYIFNSFVLRSEPNQNIENGKSVFSSSFDFLFKIFYTQIFYFGFIASFDFLFINKQQNLINNCFGIGVIFSISINNILELPLTIQYFWEENIKNGIFYFTFLSKRFT